MCLNSVCTASAQLSILRGSTPKYVSVNEYCDSYSARRRASKMKRVLCQVLPWSSYRRDKGKVTTQV